MIDLVTGSSTVLWRRLMRRSRPHKGRRSLSPCRFTLCSVCFGVYDANAIGSLKIRATVSAVRFKAKCWKYCLCGRDRCDHAMSITNGTAYREKQYMEEQETRRARQANQRFSLEAEETGMRIRGTQLKASNARGSRAETKAKVTVND